ncbi:MAG TPA: hypothetical protein VLX92_00210 [Kofleriaceae bacterium]|nr:hypothetical protein [Kofleriaceae bacterium]
MVFAIAAGTTWLACGTSPDTGDSGVCPADQPKTCPSPAPSYANDIAPLIQQYCAVSSCHAPGGSSADQPLSTYADLYARRVDAQNQLYQCKMPYAPPDPTLDERVKLLGWFVCGAPNN